MVAAAATTATTVLLRFVNRRTVTSHSCLLQTCLQNVFYIDTYRSCVIYVSRQIYFQIFTCFHFNGIFHIECRYFFHSSMKLMQWKPCNRSRKKATLNDTRTHALTHTLAHAHTCTHMRQHAHTHVYTHTHAHAPTHTHTQTYTRGHSNDLEWQLQMFLH